MKREVTNKPLSSISRLSLLKLSQILLKKLKVKLILQYLYKPAKKAVSLLLTILTAYGTVVVNSDLSVNNKHTSKKKKKP